MKLNGRRLTAPILAILIVLSALALIFGVVMGSTGLKLSELSLLFSPSTEPSAVILRSVRLPRTILSYLVGGGLAVAGCCLQGVFKNPMADSHILGVSSGAGFGAAVAMTMGAGAGLSLYGLGGIAAFAFAGGLLCVMLVFFASRVKSRISTTSLLLAGIALSSLFSALTSAIMILNRGRLDNIFMWLLGSFSSASYSKVLFAAVSILPVSAGLMLFSRPLNVMLLGEEEARMLGVDYSCHLRIIILLATVLAASCVAVSGVVGFVGLIIPHMIRLAAGPDHRTLLPCSFLGGGVFLCVMDTLSRCLFPPIELPVGVLCAICGVPFFLFIMKRYAKGGLDG